MRGFQRVHYSVAVVSALLAVLYGVLAVVSHNGARVVWAMLTIWCVLTVLFAARWGRHTLLDEWRQAHQVVGVDVALDGVLKAGLVSLPVSVVVEYEGLFIAVFPEYDVLYDDVTLTGKVIARVPYTALRVGVTLKPDCVKFIVQDSGKRVVLLLPASSQLNTVPFGKKVKV